MIPHSGHYSFFIFTKSSVVPLWSSTRFQLTHWEPWNTYFLGAPNVRSVNELICKCGDSKIREKHITVAENTLIAWSPGKYVTICMEYLTCEIYMVGKHFREANTFLWPFKPLPAPGRMEKNSPFCRRQRCWIWKTTDQQVSRGINWGVCHGVFMIWSSVG